MHRIEVSVVNLMSIEQRRPNLSFIRSHSLIKSLSVKFLVPVWPLRMELVDRDLLMFD